MKRYALHMASVVFIAHLSILVDWLPPWNCGICFAQQVPSDGTGKAEAEVSRTTSASDLVIITRTRRSKMPGELIHLISKVFRTGEAVEAGLSCDLARIKVEEISPDNGTPEVVSVMHPKRDAKIVSFPNSTKDGSAA